MPVKPNDLLKLKKPFGELVPDADVTREHIQKVIRGATKIICVGDATTERLVSFGILPNLAVIDGKERRAVSAKRTNYGAKELHCANPSGEITRKAVDTLHAALEKEGKTLVVVEGEEDMLALPLFAMSPEGSVVFYGQPLEGLVIVRITREKQAEAKDLMDRIGIT